MSQGCVKGGVEECPMTPERWEMLGALAGSVERIEQELPNIYAKVNKLDVIEANVRDMRTEMGGMRDHVDELRIARIAASKSGAVSGGLTGVLVAAVVGALNYFFGGGAK